MLLSIPMKLLQQYLIMVYSYLKVMYKSFFTNNTLRRKRSKTERALRTTQNPPIEAVKRFISGTPSTYVIASGEWRRGLHLRRTLFAVTARRLFNLLLTYSRADIYGVLNILLLYMHLRCSGILQQITQSEEQKTKNSQSSFYYLQYIQIDV